MPSTREGMHMSRKRTRRDVLGALAASASVAGLMVTAPAAAPSACAPSSRPAGLGRTHRGFAVVRPKAPQHWDPLTDSKWAFGRGQVVMTERGTRAARTPPPVRVRRGDQGPPRSRRSVYSAEVRIDEPVTRNDRDVVLIWNYQSPTRFYYAHLSQDNTIYPHNGIFVVDDADRLRIDDQWNGTASAPRRRSTTPTGTTYAWTTGRPPAGSRCTSTGRASR